MPAFRLLNQFPVYFDRAGRLADGGELRFFETNTTTPKAVYGNPAKTVNNGSTILIGSDGRASVDVWGDGRYYVRLVDRDGTLIAEANDVEVAGGTEATIPSLVNGHFLTNNGSLLLWAPIAEVPDPTGQSGKILGNDGANFLWQAPPAAPPPPPEPDVTVGTKAFTAGKTSDPVKYFVQCGESSAAASGGRTTSASVTFPTAFAADWHVSITQKHNGVTSLASIPSQAVTAQSTTGFSVRFSVEENSTFAGWNITSPVPFSWMAVGTKNVPVTP